MPEGLWSWVHSCTPDYKHPSDTRTWRVQPGRAKLVADSALRETGVFWG